MEFASLSNLFGSNIGKKIRLVREIPLLMSATSDTEEASPGYVMEQVIALTFDAYKNVNDELVDWLNGRLRQKSLCVKLKVIKLFIQLVGRGSVKFKEVLRKHSDDITTTARLAGLAGNAQMTEMYASIRQLSKNILEELYRNEDDADSNPIDKSKAYKGFGNNWNSQGFGNTLNDKKGSVISNMADKLVELSNPPSFNPYKMDVPTSFGLKTLPVDEIPTTELLFLENEPEEIEDVEKMLIQEYIRSTDVMINRRTRIIIKKCSTLDRRKFVFCVRENLNKKDSLLPCLILLEGLLHSGVYSLNDLAHLFNDLLTDLYSNHTDPKISFKAKKIWLTIKASLDTS